MNLALDLNNVAVNLIEIGRHQDAFILLNSAMQALNSGESSEEEITRTILQDTTIQKTVNGFYRSHMSTVSSSTMAASGTTQSSSNTGYHYGSSSSSSPTQMKRHQASTAAVLSAEQGWKGSPFLYRKALRIHKFSSLSASLTLRKMLYSAIILFNTGLSFHLGEAHHHHPQEALGYYQYSFEVLMKEVMANPAADGRPTLEILLALLNNMYLIYYHDFGQHDVAQRYLNRLAELLVTNRNTELANRQFFLTNAVILGIPTTSAAAA